MPHAAHFICANRCRFHLATYVGGYIVSTVGEYLPDEGVREILARSRGVTLAGRGDDRERDFMRKIGWEEIGCGRTYETMVFKAVPRPDGGCCPWRIESGRELDFHGCSDSAEAYRNHLELCEKWAAQTAET